MESSLINEDDLDNLLDYVFKQGHGVKGLSEMGLKDLPSPFIQPIEERSCMIKTLPFKAIPIIDMSNLDEDPKVEESICEAAEKLGFFQIINHGVPIPVLENVKEATRRFFELPGEEKKKYLKEHSPATNVRLTSSFFPAGEKALEWKDFLSLFYTSEENASAFWPPVCKDEALEYMKMSKGVARKLLQVLLKKLKVEGQESILMGSARINLNYYPKCPSPELTVGVGRHSDISSLTLLLQDEIGGLYVRANDGDDGWIHVPPVTGSLIINIGDALQIMSNGRYRSIEHRVVADPTRDRVSVPVFFNPSPEQIIGPFPQLLASGEKPLYKRVLYKEYATHFYKKPHNGKDTIEFALL